MDERVLLLLGFVKVVRGTSAEGGGGISESGSRVNIAASLTEFGYVNSVSECGLFRLHPVSLDLYQKVCISLRINIIHILHCRSKLPTVSDYFLLLAHERC